MNDKQASSQAAWALLMEGVAHARVDAHRLKHLINRAIRLVEASDEKEHLYQVAGDIIVGIPQRLEHLETDLDRTSLALSKMGAEFLTARLSISDKAMVDEAVESAFGRPTPKDSDVERLARKYMRKAMNVWVASVPETIRHVAEALDKLSGVEFKKFPHFYQWEWSGDHSSITYNSRQKPNQILVNGGIRTKAYQWFIHHPDYNKFSKQPMNGGPGGPDVWQYKLK